MDPDDALGQPHRHLLADHLDLYDLRGAPVDGLLVAYLRTVPRDLGEAGLVDGCSPLGALRRIVLPLALPAMVVALVFAFLVGWNDVLFARVHQPAHPDSRHRLGAVFLDELFHRDPGLW